MSATLTRRLSLGLIGTALALPLFARRALASGFPVAYPEAEWRRRLTAPQFNVLRQQGTEYPGTSPLLNEHRKGRFVCAADGNPLFDSSTKYDSGTGWPSFWKPLPRAIQTRSDSELGYTRTEVHCSRCGGHLGHVFEDGPRPTGLRYCMNGVAMKFVAG